MLIPQKPIIPGQPDAVPPVYIKSLSLENLRCFGAKTELCFTHADGRLAQWTVILGENGVGKTTVLQAIAGLSARPDVVAVKGPQGEETKRPCVSNLMSDSSWHRWHQSAHRIGLEKEKHEISALLLTGSTLQTMGGELEQQELPWHVGYQTLEQGFQLNGTLTGPQELGGFICYGYGASRQMSAPGNMRSARTFLDRVSSLVTEDPKLPNIENWLLGLDHAARTPSEHQKSFQDQLATAKTLLQSVLPDIEGIELRIGGDVMLSEAPVRALFKTPYAWVPLQALSLGCQAMIAWIGDLTMRLFDRYPTSSDPLSEPAIVLIDELDLHLHPRWQRRVIDFLTARFRNTQFIVTAHSPLVVHSETDAKLIVLQNVGDQVRANHDLEMVKNWRIDQLLTSDLFGLESAHSPTAAKRIAERTELLSKSAPSEAERRRIRELDLQIDSISPEVTGEDREAREIIREAAGWIAKHDSGHTPS